MNARPRMLALFGLALSIAGGCGDDTSPAGGSEPVGGESSTGGSPNGGSGGEGGAAELHPGPGESCNAMAQDCADPAAPKCLLDFSLSLELPSSCGEALGDAIDGETCERPTDVAGEDTCAPGLFCTRHNVPFSEPQQRRCRALCDDDGDCDADEWCLRLNFSEENEPFSPDTRLIGNCVDTCADVFDDGCPEKTRCLSSPSIDGVQTFTCFSAAANKAVGEACAANNECEHPLGCDLASGLCSPFCDATHPCGVNSSCSSTTDIGVCRGAPDAWTCDELLFADGVTCDCACGAPDPDCASELLPAQGCTGTEVCNAGVCVPPEWTCTGLYFGTDDGCDCGCGIVDPDCADATAASCMYCGAIGSCNSGSCPGEIDPLDNSVCQ